MNELVHKAIDIAALGSVALIIYEALKFRRNAKALERTRMWYEDTALANAHDVQPIATQLEMCGGCGAYLSAEKIAQCAGEKCARYLRAGN